MENDIEAGFVDEQKKDLDDIFTKKVGTHHEQTRYSFC